MKVLQSCRLQFLHTTLGAYGTPKVSRRGLSGLSIPSLQVLLLVRGSGEWLQSAQGWRTVCLLISSTGLSPEACATALEALHAAAKPPVLRAASFLPCLEAAASFIENQNKVALLPVQQCSPASYHSIIQVYDGCKRSCWTELRLQLLVDHAGWLIGGQRGGERGKRESPPWEGLRSDEAG